MPKIQLLPLLLLLAGCAARVQLPPLTAAHPASPEGREAPLPAASETLALPTSGRTNKEAESATKRAPAVPAGFEGHGGGHGAHQ